MGGDREDETDKRFGSLVVQAGRRTDKERKGRRRKKKKIEWQGKKQGTEQRRAERVNGDYKHVQAPAKCRN